MVLTPYFKEVEMKKRLNNKKVRELCCTVPNFSRGAENLLPTGAKVIPLGGGWYSFVGYAHDRSDLTDYDDATK